MWIQFARSIISQDILASDIPIADKTLQEDSGNYIIAQSLFGQMKYMPLL